MSPDPGPEQHRRPLWAAAFVTILITPVLYIAFEMVIAAVEHGRWGPAPGTGEIHLALLSIAIVFCSGIAFAIGLPLIVALRRAGRLQGGWICGAGVLSGLIGMCALMLLFGTLPDLEVLAFGALMGLAAGAVFALVAGVQWRR